MITRYQKRISGPLMDRIDLHVDVPRVEYEKLTSKVKGEPSAVIRERVEAARARQAGRFKDLEIYTNAEMGPGELRTFCPLDETSSRLMRSAMAQMNLSARGGNEASYCYNSTGRDVHRLDRDNDTISCEWLLLLPPLTGLP